MYKPLRRLVIVTALLVSFWQLSTAAMIQAKAWLAPILISSAWDKSQLELGMPVKPWPWADTWPVAKLSVPNLGIERYVLAGDSGNALAFGPGHASASASLGSTGRAVIAGHRDTHFAFLKELQPGDEFEIQLLSGLVRHYQVKEGVVVDSSKHKLLPSTDADALLLITCYPFDAIQAGGPLRYVVLAKPLLPDYQPTETLALMKSKYAL